MKKSTASSTKREAFVDTSGFYSLLVKRDSRHAQAAELLHRAKKSRRRFVTSDYVLDETATLLKARGHGHLAAMLFETVFASAACRVEWMDPGRFEETRRFFAKHQDQAWSFTDCFSFCLMHELKLQDAVTTDEHFQVAGFRVLLG